MTSSLSAWDDEYARIARAATQLRTIQNNNNNNNNHNSQYHHTTSSSIHRDQQTKSIQSGLARLHGQLSSLQASFEVSTHEANRRKVLIENLVRQVESYSSHSNHHHSTNSNNYSNNNTMSRYNNNTQDYYPPQQQERLSATQQALRHQDRLIDELAGGVSRLKDQTVMIHDETRFQNKMLDEMDNDVEAARYGLEAETLRAMKLKEDQSVWRLYMIIAGLSVLLFLLITTGLS